MPAIMQLKFQQSFEFFVVPQIQFFARVLDIPAACRDWHAQCKTVQQTLEISQVPFLTWLSPRQLLCNGKCLGAQCLVRQWRLFCVSSRRASGTNSHIFYEKVELWILRSILVSSCKHGRRGSGGVRRVHGSGMHSAGLLMKLHLALCSQRLPP